MVYTSNKINCDDKNTASANTKSFHTLRHYYSFTAPEHLHPQGKKLSCQQT